MTATYINDYILAMGLSPTWHQFDGGRNLIITGLNGRPVWRGSYEWGEELLFERRVRSYLDRLPWPGDDDPRVATAQPYMEGDF